MDVQTEVAEDRASRLGLLISAVAKVEEGGDRARLADRTVDVLSDVVEMEEFPPAVSVDILEVDVVAGHCRVATDDTRREDCTMLLHVSQSDVAYFDHGLCRAMHQWVEEAAGIVGGTWLVLLLGTDIN